MASGPITSWQIEGETMETVRDFIFGGSKITADGDCSHEIKRCLLLGRKVTTNLDSVWKSRDITLPTKVHPVKALFFLLVMYGCESWTIKKAKHRRIDPFELWCWSFESPLDCKEIQPVYPKENQSWIFIGRTDAEAETPILWPPDAKNWLIWKYPDAGKDWRWEEKGMTEDEMVGWHHRLNGHEFEWTLEVSHGHGGLACCNQWICKESDSTEWLNWTDSINITFICTGKPKDPCNLLYFDIYCYDLELNSQYIWHLPIEELTSWDIPPLTDWALHAAGSKQ